MLGTRTSLAPYCRYRLHNGAKATLRCLTWLVTAHIKWHTGLVRRGRRSPVALPWTGAGSFSSPASTLHRGAVRGGVLPGGRFRLYTTSIPEDALAYDPKMARISIPAGEGEELYRLWAMNPDLTGPASALSASVYASNLVSIRIRELMRKRIAEINVCDI